MPAQRDPFAQAALLVGASGDQLRLIFCLVVSIPLAALFPHLPSSRATGLVAPNLVHLYSLAVTGWFLIGILHLPGGTLQLVNMIVMTYLITLRGVGQQRAHLREGSRPAYPWPWLVFFAAMVQLFANHIYRYVYAVSLLTNEITGAMMVLVLKLGFFAWSVYDGQRPEAELDASQLANRVRELPSLLNFAGYCAFFPSVNIGPAFTFAAYDAFTSHSVYTSRSSRQDGRAQGMPPGRKRAAAERAVVGFFYLGLYSALASSYGYERMLEDRFLAKSMLARVAFVQATGFFARTKYYGGWSIAEAGCILAGVGYNAARGNWDAAINVRIFRIEFAQNWKVLLDNWNINTNNFLRECIYKRLARPGRKPGFKSTQATFGTSALWHGVNLSYYMTFFLGGFLQALCRHVRATIRPYFVPADGRASSPAKILYDALSIVALQMTLNYTVASFMLLEVRPTLEVWRRLGWYGHWMTFLPLTFFWAGGGQLLRQQLGARRILEHDVKLQREVAGAKGANQLGYAAAGYEELKRE